MRDIVLAIIMAGLLPVSVLHPWMGVMGWVWLSLMTPQLQTYGFMYGSPVSMLSGGATLIGVVLSRDPKSLPFVTPVVLLIVFTLWMVITYFFSLVATVDNLAQLDKVLKINLFTLVTILVLQTRKHVNVLIAVAAMSVAYYGIKGGIFTIITGGGFRVRGEGGFLHGNNEIGLGLVMTVPLLYYLLTISTRRWLVWGLWASIVLTIVAALGTQSRGALLGIGAMVLAFVLRSPKPGRLLIPIVALALSIAAFMPESWWERMGTIATYDSDASALGRLNAWTVAFNVAKENFFGAGFTLETTDIFARYAPEPEFIAVAHSIYFQVLGQHGFVGLGLYLLFWGVVFANCRWVARHSPSPQDAMLARMIETSLIGFAVGGAFLNLAYFDGPYYLMAALVVVRYKILGNVPKAKAALPAAVPSATVADRNTRPT